MKTKTQQSILLASICGILFIHVSLRSLAQDIGFFLDDWQGTIAEIPEYVMHDKTADDSTVLITIDGKQIVNKVSKYIYGNNAVTWDNGLAKNSTAMTDLKNLNPNVLRWPGGSLSDNYFWNAPYGQRPSDIPPSISPWYGPSDNSWEMSLIDYYNMREEINSQGIIVVNYGYARYGTGPDPVANAAHMAADWVRYDNGRTKFWEIGNENFGSWESGYTIDLSLNQDGQPETISGTLYGQHCKIFIDSMRTAAAEVGADIKIGVVAYDSEGVSWDAIASAWNEEMMTQVGDIADFLIVHSYFTPYATDSPVDVILNSHTVPEDIMSVLEADMSEVGKPMLPVAMTEWNIFAEGSMQQVSYINGMLAALVLGEFVKNGYGLGTRWDLVNGWNNGNDHAMFSTGGEPGVDPYNPRSAFFYMYYFQKIFGDKMVESSVTGNSSVISYASRFESGETGVVLINKSRSNEIASIELNNIEPGLKYYTYTLTGGDDNGNFSRKVLINGIETDEEGGGPDNYTSIKALAFSTEDGIKVELGSRTVVYILIDKKGPLSYVSSKIKSDPSIIRIKFSDTISLVSNPVDLRLVSNELTPLTITGIEPDPVDPKVLIIHIQEMLVRNDKITVSYSGSEIMDKDENIVLPFFDMPVTNLLPGPPVDVTFKVINTESGNAVEDCILNFNLETKNTDANGTAVFTVETGTYELNAEKLLYSDISDLSLDIVSDTSLTISLDSAYYNVSFQVTDNRTNETLSYVNMHVNGISKQTNSVGIALFELHGSNQSIAFSKTNYMHLQDTFTILSDTLLKVQLTRSHANIKFNLRSGEQPVPNATVNFGEISLETNAVGSCIFESVLLNSVVNYTVEKDNFYSLDGALTVTWDSTLILQMEKSVANVMFHISSESENIKNAYVVLEQDTSVFNSDGKAGFYNVTKEQEYVYSIFSESHKDYNGTVFLKQDTTIEVLLEPNSIKELYETNKIYIYPNPAKDFLHINIEHPAILKIELFDISGSCIQRINVNTPQTTVILALNFNPGIYFLKIESNRQVICSKVVIE